MKKTYKYIALAALALGFTACTQDDDFAPQQEDIVKIASANIATEVQTRVNTLDDGTTFENEDRILLVNNSRDNKNSGTYTYNGTTWGLAEGLVLYASGAYATNDFTAYYPAVADENYNFPTDQSTETGIKQADRMVATTTGVEKDAAVALSFERRNAMITIVPTIAEELTGQSISGLQVEDVTNPYHSDNSYTAIIAPSDEGFEVKVKVGDSDEPLTATTSTRIEAGKRYTFNLKVGKDVAEITSVSVKDWTEKPIVDNPTGSEATEVFIHSTVSGTTAAIDIVSGATDGVKAAIEALFTANPMVTTLTVNGTPNEVQQGALAKVLTTHSGVKLIMDMNGDEVSEAVTNLTNDKQLGGYTLATDETTTTYTVYTEAGLNKWKEAVENETKTNLTLGADIILSTDGITVDENGKPNKSNWRRIYPFTGSLEGDGHSIVNLRIISSGIEAAGFIGKTEGATIKNLTIVNPVVYGRKEVSAGLLCELAGLGKRPTSIINCHVQGGSIGGAVSYAGGLIGLIRMDVNNCHIYGCTNSAKVTATTRSGGILGGSQSTVGDDVVIAACANTGEISRGSQANSRAGGIAGQVLSQEKLIACYTTRGNLCEKMDATVKGSYYVASADTDGIDGTTTVADATALNNANVVNAMNTAIETWNNSATVKVAYRWKVGTILPELEEVTVSE